MQLICTFQYKSQLAEWWSTEDDWYHNGYTFFFFLPRFKQPNQINPLPTHHILMTLVTLNWHLHVLMFVWRRLSTLTSPKGIILQWRWVRYIVIPNCSPFYITLSSHSGHWWIYFTNFYVGKVWERAGGGGGGVIIIAGLIGKLVVESFWV